MKTITLNLGAQQLVLGPLLAATLRDFKDQIAAAGAGQLQPLDMIDLTVKLAHAAARRVNANVTEEAIANVVDMDNFNRVFAACWGVTVPEGPAKKKAVKASP